MVAKIYKIIFWQNLLLVLLLSMIGLLVAWQAAYSALVGSVCYVLPMFLFVLYFSFYVHIQATIGMGVFFIGEKVKLFLSAILFVLAIRYLHVHIIYGVVGLMLAIVAFWISSAVYLCNQGPKESNA